MARRYGVLEQLDKKDVWILRQFRLTLAAARVAETAAAVRVLDLGWGKAKIGIATFDLEAMARYESYRALAGAEEGEVAIVMHPEVSQQLAVRTFSPARLASRVVAK